MGFLDAVLGGRKKLKAPAADRLFAMATAYVKMEIEMGLKTTGKAAIVFQPLATGDFEKLVADMEELLRSAGEETGTTIRSENDSFGYRWMVLEDPDMDDLVVGVNTVSTELQGGGYGDRLLAAVFAFDPHTYWIYNYKRGAFYPFSPSGGEQQRDSEREMRIKAQIGADLPVEEDLSRWFPLWGAPI